MECVVRVSSLWRGEHEFSKINAQSQWGSFNKHSGKNRRNQIETEFAEFRNGESGLDWSCARQLDRTSTPPKKLCMKWYSIPETEYDEFAVSAEIKLPDKHLILKYLRHMQLSIAYLRFLELLSFDLKLLRKYPVFGIVLKIYIVVLYFVIYIAIGSFMNSKQQYIFYLTLLKSLAQTTKFSLTSQPRVAFLARVYRCTSIFPNNFPWQVLIARVYNWKSFLWLEAAHRRPSFPWQIFGLDKFYLFVCTI